MGKKIWLVVLLAVVIVAGVFVTRGTWYAKKEVKAPEVAVEKRDIEEVVKELAEEMQKRSTEVELKAELTSTTIVKDMIVPVGFSRVDGVSPEYAEYSVSGAFGPTAVVILGMEGKNLHAFVGNKFHPGAAKFNKDVSVGNNIFKPFGLIGGVKKENVTTFLVVSPDSTIEERTPVLEDSLSKQLSQLYPDSHNLPEIRKALGEGNISYLPIIPSISPTSLTANTWSIVDSDENIMLSSDADIMVFSPDLERIDPLEDGSYMADSGYFLYSAADIYVNVRTLAMTEEQKARDAFIRFQEEFEASGETGDVDVEVGMSDEQTMQELKTRGYVLSTSSPAIENPYLKMIASDDSGSTWVVEIKPGENYSTEARIVDFPIEVLSVSPSTQGNLKYTFDVFGEGGSYMYTVEKDSSSPFFGNIEQVINNSEDSYDGDLNFGGGTLTVYYDPPWKILGEQQMSVRPADDNDQLSPDFQKVSWSADNQQAEVSFQVGGGQQGEEYDPDEVNFKYLHVIRDDNGKIIAVW
ncbi:MAG TPA: hypothetical protein ENF20_02390 [Candidatus Marinimicrobia bacterium]|nr:hypothetical protein [Candidatus Neomarinimicrobiota bacterium]